MADDVINGREASTQNGGGDGKKDDGARDVKDGKDNEAFVQVSLSIFSGILGGIAVEILNDNDILNVTIVAIMGIIIWIVVKHHYGSYKKSPVHILTAVSLVLIAALVYCLGYCAQK